jgi:hypothetical protein
VPVEPCPPAATAWPPAGPRAEDCVGDTAPAAGFAQGALARTQLTRHWTQWRKILSTCQSGGPSMAPRAGLEPAAYCLGGKPEPDQAPLTTALLALTCNDNGLTTPEAPLLLLRLAPSLASRRSLAPLISRHGQGGSLRLPSQP